MRGVPRYYDHAITTVEEIQKGTDTPQPITKMGAEEPTPFAKHSLAEWWAKVNKNSSSKVVDENGEPKVVYHVTDADFNTFDMGKARQSSDIPAAFFSSGTDDWADMGSTGITPARAGHTPMR